MKSCANNISSMAKEHRIMFRADETLFQRIEKLGSKLGLGRGEILRLCVEETIEKYLNVKGDVVVINRYKWDAIIKGFSKRLKQEIIQEIIDKVQKSPGIQKLRKLAAKGELEIDKS